MQTTSLLVELMVIGLWACSWVYPLASLVVPNAEIKRIVLANNIGLLIAIAAIYFIGMFTNLIADISLRWFDSIAANKFGGKQEIQKLRVAVFTKSGDAYQYLLQRRSMVRVFRANWISTMLFLIVYIFNVNNTRKSLVANSIVFSLVLLGLAALLFYAYARTLRGYFAFIKQAGEIVKLD